MNQTTINEKNELISQYKEHVENLKKTIDSLGNEYQKKISLEKDNIQFNNFNTKNIINISKISQTAPNVSKFGGGQGYSQNFSNFQQNNVNKDDLELKLLEMESKIFLIKYINGLISKF